MRKIYFLAFTCILSSCANPQFQEGMDRINRGDNLGAYQQFVLCATEGDLLCMNNAGVAAIRAGKREQARHWWTLAARHGSPSVITNLAESGMPIPSADLKASKEAEAARANVQYERQRELDAQQENSEAIKSMADDVKKLKICKELGLCL